MSATRKAITLPGGGKCVVRRLTANDFAITEGEIPIFHEPAAGRETKTGPSKRQIESGVRFLRVVLLCCVSPITLPDGTTPLMVSWDLVTDEHGNHSVKCYFT